MSRISTPPLESIACISFPSPPQTFYLYPGSKAGSFTVRETRFVKLDDEILDVGRIVFIDDVPLLSRPVCFRGSRGFYVELDSKL